MSSPPPRVSPSIDGSAKSPPGCAPTKISPPPPPPRSPPLTARPVAPSYAATGVDGMCVIHMCRPLLSVESYARTELPGPHSSLGGGGDPSESTPSPSTPSRPGGGTAAARGSCPLYPPRRRRRGGVHPVTFNSVAARAEEQRPPAVRAPCTRPGPR